MAAWAVAWAGSKPIASLADGSLARLVGVRPTGILLATPALLPALALIMLLVVDKLSYAGALARLADRGEGTPLRHLRGPARAPPTGPQSCQLTF